MTAKEPKKEAEEADEVFPRLLQLAPTAIYSCQGCQDFVPYRVQKTEGACEGLCAHPDAPPNAWSVLGDDLQTPEDICPRLKATPERPSSATLSRRFEALLDLGSDVFGLKTEDDGSTEFLRQFHKYVFAAIQKARARMS